MSRFSDPRDVEVTSPMSFVTGTHFYKRQNTRNRRQIRFLTTVHKAVIQQSVHVRRGLGNAAPAILWSRRERVSDSPAAKCQPRVQVRPIAQTLRQAFFACSHLQTNMPAYMNMHIYIQTCMHIHTCVRTYTLAYAHAFTQTHTLTHTRIRTHMHTDTYPNIHTFIHSYIMYECMNV